MAFLKTGDENIKGIGTIKKRLPGKEDCFLSRQFVIITSIVKISLPTAEGSNGEMDMTQEKAEFLKSRFDQCPFNQTNGIRARLVEDGYAEVTVQSTEHSINIWGLPHGGLLFSLADVAVGLAVHSLHQGKAVTVNANVNFIRSSQDGSSLLGVAQCVRCGRSIGFFQAEVYDNLGTLLLSGQYVIHLSQN